MHGAAKGTPARAKAEEQLRLARDELMEILLAIARDTTQSANDRLKAITWALERAGFKGGLDIDITGELKTKGYVEVLAGLFTDAGKEHTKRLKKIEAENNTGRKAVAAPDAGTPASEILASLAAEAQPPRREPANVIEGEFVNGDDTPPRHFNMSSRRGS
jgi:hypothetical protein